MINYDGRTMTKDQYKQIFNEGVVTFNESLVLQMSLEFIDFIDLCLTWDYDKRPTAEKLLTHPFLAKKQPDPNNPKTIFCPIGDILITKPAKFQVIFKFKDNFAVERVLTDLKNLGCS